MGGLRFRRRIPGGLWAPQNEINALGGIWLRFADLVDGAVADFPSHEGFAHHLIQATGTAQPAKSAIQILFDGGDSLVRGATGDTARFVNRTAMPDDATTAAGPTPGVGGVWCGIARKPGTTDQFYVLSYGANTTSGSDGGSRNPSAALVRYNPDKTITKLSERPLNAIYPTISGCQGLCVDPDDGSLWLAVAEGALVGKALHFDYVNNVDLGSSMQASWPISGIAIVPTNAFGGNSVKRMWFAEEAATGNNIECRSMVDNSIINAAASTALANQDILFFEPGTKCLMLTYGANGVAGSIRCYSVSGASGAPVFVGDIVLPAEWDAVEGVVWEGTKIYGVCDRNYHVSSGVPNAFLEADIVPPMTMDLSVHVCGQVTSIPSGADAYIECASSNGTDGPLSAPGSGFGIYDATVTTLTAAIGDGTHSNIIAGVTVPNLTAAFRRISLVASKTNNLMTLYCDGLSVGTQSLATHVGGIPTCGLLKLGIGNNAARQFNGGLKDSFVICGLSNRQMYEAYLAGL
jgi:hypothetical protein